MDHTHPDHTCYRCRAEENALRPDRGPEPRRKRRHRDQSLGWIRETH